MKIKTVLRINKSITEEELIIECRKGQVSAQRSLYDQLAPKMLGVCLRYIQAREEAEHVMIGGIVKVFQKLDQFKGDGSFEGWVRRIVVNDCLMYIRKNRNMFLEIDIDSVSESPDVGTLDDMLQVEDLMNIIKELPVGYRMVFNLYAIEGYSHAEISNVSKINESTSKSQLSRARKWLQTRLVEIESEFEKNITNGSAKNRSVI